MVIFNQGIIYKYEREKRMKKDIIATLFIGLLVGVISFFIGKNIGTYFGGAIEIQQSAIIKVDLSTQRTRSGS